MCRDIGAGWKLSVQKHIMSTKLGTSERQHEDLFNIVRNARRHSQF